MLWIVGIYHLRGYTYIELSSYASTLFDISKFILPRTLGMLASSIAAIDSDGNRFLNSTMVDASNGHFELYSFIPGKYWRYGFSLTCRTTQSSLHFSFCLMICDPNAIRAGCAGCPLSTNCFAYSRSATSQGTKLANLTHSFPDRVLHTEIRNPQI